VADTAIFDVDGTLVDTNYQPCVPQLMVDPGTCLDGMGRSTARA